jgi:TP901 family phage tail tape measure protein
MVAQGTPLGNMVIHVGMDGVEFGDSLRQIHNQIRASMRSMKADMAVYSQVGDNLGKLEHQYEDLKLTMTGLQKEQGKLGQSYTDLTAKGKKNSDAAISLTNKINDNIKSQALYRQQLEKVKVELDAERRGTTSLMNATKDLSSITSSISEKFKAQGKTLQANHAEYKNLNSVIQTRSRLITAQKAKLQDLINMEHSDSDAILHQRAEIAKLEATQATSQARYKKLRSEVGFTTTASLKFRDSLSKTSTGLKNMGSRITDAGRSVQTFALGMGAAFVYGSKQSLAFQKKLTDVKSLLESDGESAQSAGKIQKDMMSQGVKLSQKYGVSIQDIGDGYETLVRKGDSGRQAMAAMEKMLKASVASGSSFKDTTKVAMNVMEQFYGKAKNAAETARNTTKVTNGLAYAADHGSAKFVDLGYSMNYVGDYAKSVGYNMNDMAAAIEIMSRRGVEGTSAGTGLRGVIASLVHPSDKAAGAMEDIGLKTQDAHKNLLPLSDIVDQLRNKLDKMGSKQRGDLLSTMFGRTSLPTITALMTKSGKQIDNFSDKIKNAEKNDYAGTVTQRMMKSGQQQLNIFKQTMTTTLMDFSSTLLPTFTMILKHINSLAVGFTKLPKGVKTTVAVLLALVAAAAPVGIALGGIMTTVGALASPFGIAALAIGGLVTSFEIADNKSKPFSKSLTKVHDEIKLFWDFFTDSKSLGKDVSMFQGVLSTKDMSRISQNAAELQVIIDKVKGILSGLLNDVIIPLSTAIANFSINHIKLVVGLLGTLAGIKVGTKVFKIGVTGVEKVKSVIDFIKNDKGFKAKSIRFVGKWIGKGVTTGAKATWTAVKAIGKGIAWTGKWIGKTVLSGAKASIAGVKAAGKGIAIGARWTGKVAVAAAKASINGIKTAALASGRAIKTMTLATLSFGKTAVIWTVQKVKILAVAAAQKTAAVASKAWAVAQKVLNVAMDANPIGLVITAIALLVAGLIAAYKHSKTFRSIVNAIGEGIKKTFAPMGSFFKGVFKVVASAFSSVGIKIKSYVHSFVNVYKNGFSTIKAATKLFKDFFTGNWSDLGKDFKHLVSSAWKTVKSYFKAGFGVLNDLTGGMLGNMFNAAEKTGSKIINFFKKLPSRMSSGIKAGAKDLGNAGIFVGNKLLSGIGSVVDGIEDGINWLLKKVGMKKMPMFHMPKLPYFSNGTVDSSGNFVQDSLVHVGDGNKTEVIKHKDGSMELTPNTDTITMVRKGDSILGGDKTEQLMGSGFLPKFSIGTWIKSAADFVKGGFGKLKSSATAVYDEVSHPIKLMDTILSNFTQSSVGKMTGVTADLAGGTVKFIAGQMKKFVQNTVMGGGANPKGADVNRWKPYIVKALKMNGLSTSKDMISKVLRQIQTESGGNPKAVQHGYTDVNTISGDLAKGLMQTISATFNAYKFKGHNDIFNGFDNLLAALNYAKKRYGKALSALGQGHGYANGTLSHVGGAAVLGDAGRAEPFLTTDGKFGISPSKPTLYQKFPYGTRVWKSVSDFASNLPHFKSGTKKVWVKGYTKSNGTKVKGYWRTVKTAPKTTKKATTYKSTRSSSNSSIDATRALRDRMESLYTDFRIGTLSTSKFVSQMSALKNAKGHNASTDNYVKSTVYTAQHRAETQANTARRKAEQAKSKKITDQISTVLTEFRSGKISQKTEKSRLQAIEKNNQISTAQRNRIISAISTAAKQTNAKLTHFQNGIKSAATKYESSVKTINNELNTTIKDAAKNIQGSFGLFDSANTDSSGMTGVDLLDNLKQQDNKYTQFYNLIKQLRSKTTSTGSKASEDFIDEVEGLGVGSIDQISHLVGSSSVGYGDYLKAWNSRNSITNSIAIDQSTTAIADAKKQLATAQKTFLTNLKSDTSKYKQAGFTIGQYTLTGIIDGFKNMSGALKSQTTKIANSIVSTIKKTLKIHSPSRVTHALGGFTVQGLINGLKDNASGVVQAASNLSNSISSNIVPLDGTMAVEGMNLALQNTSGSNSQNILSSTSSNDVQTLIALMKQLIDIETNAANGLNGAGIYVDNQKLGQVVYPVIQGIKEKTDQHKSRLMGGSLNVTI